MEEEGEEKEEEEEEEESLYLEEQGDGAVDEAGRRPRALDGVRLARRRDAVGQGLTLVHVGAQLKRLMWNKGYLWGV